MIRLILLCVFLVCVLLLGSVKVGYFSFSNYATAVMSFFLMLNYGKVKDCFVDVLKIYLLFAFVFFITLNINGDIIDFDLSTYYIARILPSIVTFLGVFFYVKTDNDLGVISAFLLVLALINSLISILQYNVNPLAVAVSEFFSVINEVEYTDFLTAKDSILGAIPITGIWGNVVNNGLMILAFSFLPFAFKRKSIIYVILSIGTLVTSFYAMFLVQQRTAFFLMIIGSLFVLIRNLNLKYFLSLVLLMMAIVLVFNNQIDSLIPNMDMGRFADVQDKDRQVLYELSLDWVGRNFLFGGPVAYSSYMRSLIGIEDPHNFFISALVYGGIFGGGVMIFMFFKVFSFSFVQVVKGLISPVPDSDRLFIFSLIMIVALINGMTHNTSFVYGNVSLWVIYALLIKSYTFQNAKKEVNCVNIIGYAN